MIGYSKNQRPYDYPIISVVLQNLVKKFRTQEMTIACGCHGCQNNPRLYKKLITSICDSFMLQIKLAIVCLNRIFITIFSYFNQNP